MRDAKTKEFMTLWGRKNVPTAKVKHGLVQAGTYTAFALLGWIEPRRGWPLVGLQLALFRDTDMDRSAGSLTMGLPLLPKTERHVCGFLQDLGWDGRVWPYKYHGWPEGTTDESDLLGILRTANLGATLTFPPIEGKGVSTVRVYVDKPRETFYTAPFGETIPKYLDNLRELAKDMKPFKSDWNVSPPNPTQRNHD